jgi:hypothetical protein
VNNIRNRRGRFVRLVSFIAIIIAGPALLLAHAQPARAAVVFGQLDDFENGTRMGWQWGDSGSGGPVNVSTGGPQGTGDNYLRNVSSGTREGSKMVVFNEAQWRGDYNAARVTRVEGWVSNLGSTPLHLRLAMRSAAGTTFGSRAAVVLPANTPWQRVTFDLTSAGLVRVGGSQTLSAARSNVSTLRLISAAGGPSWVGDDINATLGVDDLRALHLPGDANFDNRVNAVDLRTWRRNYGAGGAGVDWAEGDFNFDNRVDARDAALLRRNYGRSVSIASIDEAPVAVAPEPGPLSLLLLTGLAVTSRRPGRRSRGAR